MSFMNMSVLGTPGAHLSKEGGSIPAVRELQGKTRRITTFAGPVGNGKVREENSV
jgi:hypothetical protein